MGVTFGVSSREQIFRLFSRFITPIYIHTYIYIYIYIRLPEQTKALFLFFSFFRFFYLCSVKIAVYVQNTTVVDFIDKLRFLLIVGLVLRVYWGVAEHR